MLKVTISFGPEEIEEIFRWFVQTHYPDLNPGSVKTNIDTLDRGGGTYVSSITVTCTKDKKPEITSVIRDH